MNQMYISVDELIFINILLNNNLHVYMVPIMDK